MKLIPAILTDSFTTLQNEVSAVQMSSLIEAVHVDVIDGNFADNLTVTPLDLTVGDFEPLKIDFHLMTDEPMDYIYESIAVKEYLPIRRMIGQVERMSHQADFLQEVKIHGWEPVLALDLFTPLEAIEEEVWRDLDKVLLMGVEAGLQGQAMNFHVLEKIQELRKFFPDPQRMKIIVDGGIKHDNLVAVLSAGADEVVVGSEVWHSSDPLAVIEEFYRLAQQNQLS